VIEEKEYEDLWADKNEPKWGKNIKKAD